MNAGINCAIGFSKSLLRLVLIFALLITLSSCGKIASNPNSNGSVSIDSANGLLSATDVKLPLGASLLSYAEAFVRDDTIYIYSKVSPDVLMLSTEPLGKKLGNIKTQAADSLCVDSDGDIWLIRTDFTNDEYGNDSAQITLTEISSDGVIKRSSDVSFLHTNSALVPDKILIDDKGYMHIVANSHRGNCILLLDTNREELTEQSVLCVLNDGSDIARLSTGEVVVGNRTDSGYELKLVDVEKSSWGKRWTLDAPFKRIHSGNDNYLFLDDGANIFRYSLDTGELSLQANCIISGLQSFGTLFSETNPNQYLILRLDDSDYSDATRVLTVLENSSTTDNEPVILRLATLNSFYLNNIVLSFNRSNSNTKIEIVDYSVYNTSYNDNTGTTKMIADIITGKAPDIYDLTNLPVDKYAAKNMLANLYEFMDNDPEIERDNYLENILTACEVDGKLYEIIPWYFISTVAGRTKDLGENIGWTFNEFKQLTDSMPDMRTFSQYFTRYDFLKCALFLNTSELIDWSNGDCYFDSEYFIDILEFAATLPTEHDPSWDNESCDIYEGKQLLIYHEFNLINSVNRIRSLYRDDITFKGFPASTGSGNVISTYLSLGISAASPYQNEAWSFIRGFLTESYQNSMPIRYAMLPLMSSSLDKVMESHRSEVATWNGVLIMGDLELKTFKEPDYDIPKAYELIRSADRVMRVDYDLMNIVLEEADSFFASDKSAAEVARIIQARVQIYVSEQK